MRIDPQLLDDVVAVCAAYRARHDAWPDELRLDVERFQALAWTMVPVDFQRLNVLVRVRIRRREGISAGGRGVVDMGAPATPATTALTRDWLGNPTVQSEIPGGKATNVRVAEEAWLNLARDALRAYPEQRELGLEHLMFASPMGSNELESDESEHELELIFWAAYYASLVTPGVPGKLFFVGRWSYGWRPDPAGDPVLVLQHDNAGGPVRYLATPIPSGLLERFPARPDDLEEVTLELGRQLTAIIQDSIARATAVVPSRDQF